MGLNLSHLKNLATPYGQTPTPATTSSGTVTNKLAELAAAQAKEKQEAQAATVAKESAGTVQHQQVADKILELQGALLQNHPRMPHLLHDIWTTLKSYPECVTLLSEEQIEVVVSGLEKQVDTDLAAISLKSATKSGKKGPVSASDLGF